jgi:outer membrane protein TolC
MRIAAILSFLFLFHFGLPVLGYGQMENPFDQVKDDISIKLPPLSVLIDSAIVHSAKVKFIDQQLIIDEYKLKAKRIEWSRNIGLQANTGYGNLYNYSSSTTGSIDPIPTTAIRSQRQYSASVYINLPLNTLLDRKNQIKITATELEQAKSSAISQREEIRQQVIVYYNGLIVKQRVFRIKVKNLETVRVNMQMVEKQFLNGVIPLTDYTQMLGNVANLETDFENAKMDFLTAYMILEEIVGLRFNLVKTTPEIYDFN